MMYFLLKIPAVVSPFVRREKRRAHIQFVLPFRDGLLSDTENLRHVSCAVILFAVEFSGHWQL